MKRINIYYWLALAAVCVGLFTHCDGQLDQQNPNNATEDSFWQDENDFELALTSCYAPLRNGLTGGYYGTRAVMMRIARADEVEFRNDIGEVFQACYFTNTNGNSLSQGMFYQFYNGIYRTNLIMQKLEEKSENLSQDFIDKIKAECLFLRGFYLFQLGKEFKNAPLRLSASQDIETFPLEKSSQAEIWAQAEKDLTTSVSMLPDNSEVKSKPTKGTAKALLGKIYVYSEDFDKAIGVLEPLIGSYYSLVDDFNWNFDNSHEHNSESIFEIVFDEVGGSDVWSDEDVDYSQTTTRAKEYAASEVSGWYEATPTKQMMEIFLKEKDKDGNPDYRARVSAAWDYDGSTYYMKPFREIFAKEKWNTFWILKYQNWNTAESEGDPPISSINDRAFRYADVILLLAESYLRSSTQRDLQKAVGYINMIRERANLNDYSGAMDYQSIFNDLEHQRAIEFFVEGERFYDLRRWGLLEERIKTCNEIRYKQLITGKVGDTNRYYYYPIPSKELETNTLCTPNEGW